MKTCILFLLIISGLFYSCKESKKELPIIKYGTLHDTLYATHPIYFDSIVPERYFLFSYQTRLLSSHDIIYGDDWLSCNSFPSHHGMDSIISTFLPNKRSCYDNIIITSVFEFKNKEDFISFGKNEVSSPTYKHKNPCNDDKLIIEDFSPNSMDSAIIIPAIDDASKPYKP